MAIAIWYAAAAFGVFTGESVDGHTAGETFRDCKDYCPAMVVIPQGKFTIGSPASEAGRGSDENPQQVVTIAYALAVGKYPITRGEFAVFVKDTGHTPGACAHWDGKSFRAEEGIFWNNTFDPD
jgi:formylglycine-generating enzyme required for sulfatase activity